MFIYKPMKKLTNTKKNENKKILLEAFSFSNIQEAKKYLGMKKDKALWCMKS